MSQVKKLQSGGSSPETKPYGVFRMNGRELDGKTAIARLTSIGNGLDLKQREAFSVAKRALEDGHTVSYDADKNLLSVKDKSGNEIFTNYTNTKARYDNSNWKKFWGAQFEDEADQFKRGLRNFALVGMYEDTPTTTKPTADNRTKLRKGSGWFDYDTDEDGNKVFRENGMRNQDILAHLKEMQAYYDDADQSTLKDRYDISAFGTSRNLEIFRNSYNNLSDKANYWSGLIDRIKSNQLRKGDIEALGLFGYTPNESEDEDPIDRRTPKLGDLDYIDPNYTGNKDALRNAGLGIYKHNDGYWQLTGEANNPYLTDTWFLPGYDIGLDGYDWLHKGRFYTKDNAFDKTGKYFDFQKAISGFMGAWNSDKTFNDRYDLARQSRVHFYEEDDNKFAQGINPNEVYNQDLTKYFRDNGLNGRYTLIDASGNFSNIGDNKIFAYIDDTNRKINPNDYNFDTVNYLVKDSSGKITPYTADNIYSTFTQNDSPYGGITYQTTGNEYTNIKGRDYAEYAKLNVGGQNNTLYVDRNGHLFLGRKNESGEDMKPEQIYDTAIIEELLRMTPQELNQVNNINKRLSKATAPIDWWWSSWRPIQSYKNRKLYKAGLPTYQFGGTLRNADNETISNSIKDAKTDYTSAHAIDGSQGGLSDNDKLKIGAAIGDLAGVGLTFAPGIGNIAGAAVGVGSSIANYEADKALGRKNAVGHLVGGLVLDAATIIPLLGTGAKAVKAANTVRNLGETAIKLLAISGAAAPVITAVQRIQNGEKYTSADLAQAISGLSSAIVGTNMFAKDVGKSKLASELSSKKSHGFDANTKVTAKVKGTDGEFTTEASPQNLRDFVRDNPTEAKAIEAVISTAKNEQNVTLNEKQAKSILSQLNIKTEKGKLSLNPFKKDSKFGSRGESTVNYETHKAPETRSTLGYFFNPRARSKMLNEGLNGTYGEELSAAFDRLNTRGSYSNNQFSRLRDRALVDAGVYTPWRFSNLLGTSNNWNPVTYRNAFTFGGKRYFRDFDQSFSRVGNAEIIGNPVAAVSNPKPLLYGIDRGRSPEATARMERALQQYLYTHPDINYLNPEEFNKRLKFFRKGGKIYKAQSGIELPAALVTDKAKALPTFNQFASVLNPSGLATKKTSLFNPDDFNPNGSLKSDPRNGLPGGINDHKLGINWANVYDTGRALTAQAFANKAFDHYMDNFNDLEKRQFIAPQIDQVRYNDSDIQQGFNNATRPYLENNYIGNDGKNSLAYNLARSQALSNIENQKASAITSRINQVNEQNRQIDAQNTASRVAAANEKSHWLTNIESQKDLARSNKINTDWANIWGPLTNQFGQQTRDAQNKLYDLELQQQLGTAQAAAQTQFVNEINKFRNDWLNDPNAGRYYSYEDWMEANHPAEYQLALTNMRNSIMGNTYSNQRLRGTQDGQALGYRRLKSGGKVSSKSNRRSHLEDIAVNSSKQAQQNVAKMSDHLMRMLQQLMK